MSTKVEPRVNDTLTFLGMFPRTLHFGAQGVHALTSQHGSYGDAQPAGVEHELDHNYAQF